MKRLAVTAIAALFCAGPVAAADPVPVEITGVSGSVLVDQDGKLTPAAAKTRLAGGDRIVAKNGKASLRYADGCVVTVETGAMATVGPRSPCAGGQGLVTAGGAAAQGLGGVGDFGLALIGWGVMGVTMIVLADDDDDNRSVSP